jgi:4-hydroxybenzoate polyprenyltransferase
MRPYQWIKNTLVFAALIFSLSFRNLHKDLRVLGAFVIFCLVSSAIYLMNDLKDKKEDKEHPVKSTRPIASGKLNKDLVTIVIIILLALTMLAGWYLSTGFFVILLIYVFLNFGYSFGLKKVVILDVIILSFGFVLRALAGASVIGVVASPWLFLCTLMLALLLGFGKRHSEIIMLADNAELHRRSLKEYSVSFLENLMIISAATAIVTYSLYTMSTDTISRIGSSNLIYTTPMVIFGIFRYVYLVIGLKKGGDPTKIFLLDIQMIINLVLWILTVMLILILSA